MKTKIIGRIAASVLLLNMTAAALYAQTTAWRGTNGTNWNNAGNWSAGLPTSTSTVIIGDVNYTNQPVISNSVTIATLTFNSARACTLTVSAGGSLTVTGNASGTWTARQTHLISIGAQTMTVNGTLTMGSAMNNRYRLNVSTSTGTLTAGTLVLNTGSTLTVGVGGTATVNGNFSGAGTLTFSGAGNLYIGGNNTTTGTFNRGTGTVTYNGTGTQTVRGTTYYNLTINKTAGTASLGANTTVNTGTLSVLLGTLNLGTRTLTASGNIAVNGTISGTGAIALSGANRTIDGSGSITTTGTTTISGGAKTILPTASLSFAGTININTGITVTNNGTITTTAAGGITGSAASSTWINNSGSRLNIAGPLLATGTLTANANPNAVNYNGTTSAQTVKPATYDSLIVTKGTQTATLAANTTVNSAVSIASGTLNGSIYTLTVDGNVSNSGTLTMGSTLTLSGTGGYVSGSGTYTLADLTVTGSGVTINAATILSVSGNISTSGSGTLTHNSGGTGVINMSGAGRNITGTGIELDDLNITGSVTMNSSISLSGNLAVPGTLNAAAGTVLTMTGNGSTISGAGTINLSTLSAANSITAASSVQISENLSGGTITATGGTFTFSGSPSQLSGTANLNNVTISATRSLQLTTNSLLGIAGTFTASGSLDAVNGGIPNTVNYNGSGAQSIVATTYNNLTLSNGNTKSAAGGLTVNGNLLIGPGTTFSAGANTHTVQGNWTNNGAFTAGTSTILLNGPGDAIIGGTGTTTFSTLTINKDASTNTVTGSISFSAATLNVTNGNLAMGSNNVTITGTRTGNGIITGTITHTHSFAAGTSYSFEGPNNTVTFSTVGTVTSVSITVIIGSVGDFPFGGSINRQYNISVTGAGYTAALRLHYQDGELNGNSEASMQLWRYNGTTWAVSGKTANDATNNWVEQNSLTNITNRWTISDDQNAVRWNGGTTSWSTASNWTVVQGSPSTPPSANDIAQIGTGAFTNQPIISSSVTVKNIVFGSVQPASLTIGAGGSLTASGINGQWSANASHTIDAGSQAVTVNGNLALSDGTAGHVINLNIGSGAVSVTGTVTESGGANITLGTGNLNIGGDFIYSAGTFAGGSGTVTYNGPADQIVAGITYYNLSISKSAGTANINSAVGVGGNLALSTGGTLAVNADLNVSGSINIGASTTLNAAGSTIAVGGSWTRTGAFTYGTSTIVFNGTADQSIGATTFNNLIVNKSSGIASPSGSLTINGNLTDSTGTLDLGTLTANRSAFGGTFRMGANALLRLSGAANFPSNFSANSLSAASNVEYYGTIAQTIPASITFGGITIANTGAGVTLGGPVTAGGNVLIQPASSLNGGSFTLIDQGNWTNNGTFTASTGTVRLAGAGKSLGGSSSTTFNNLTVSGSYTAASDITVGRTLNITGTYSSGNTSVTLNGDLTNNGTFSSGGTITFSGTGSQNIAMNSGFSSTGTVNFNGTVAPVFSGSSPPQFAAVNINNTAGISPTTGWTVNGAFTVAAGAIFDGGSAIQRFNSAFSNNGTVASSGAILFSPAADAAISMMGTSFSSTGTVEFGGSGLLTITGPAPSITTLTISNTNGSGVTLPAAWTISGDLNISVNAILNGSSYIYALNGSFNNDGTFNGQTSTINLTGSGESISGESTIFNNLTIATGAAVTANSGFNIAGNLVVNGSLDATGQEIIFTGSSPSTISGTVNPISLDILTISKSSAVVSLSQNLSGLNQLTIKSGSLDIAAFAVNEEAGMGTLSIEPGALLRIGGTAVLPGFSTYELDPACTVEYYGTQTISSGATYGGLLLSGTGTKTFASPLTAEGDMTISTGTPAVVSGAVTLTVNGNWQNSGSFSAGSGTVLLGGTSKSFTGATTFNNLTVNGTETNSGAITVDGSLSGTGTLTQGSGSNLTINGTPVSIASLNASASANTVTYAGSSAQSVLSTSYYDLVFNNAGTKTASSGFMVNGDMTINIGSNLTINPGVIIQVLGKVTTSGSLNNGGQIRISD